MIYRSASLLILVWLAAVPALRLVAADFALRQLVESTNAAEAFIRVDVTKRSPFQIPREITGKFAEHLGFNIYHGMDAQILENPTFAEYPFWNGHMTPDGVTEFQTRTARVASELRGQAQRFGWPETELEGLVQAREDALAAFWTRMGKREDVEPSPDVAPSGGRAQRLQIKGAGEGIAQWAWLPLHRIREYQFEILARSPGLRSLTVSLWSRGGDKPAASAAVQGLSPEWKKLTGSFTVPGDLPKADSYKFALTASAPGQLVVAYVFLRPADNVNGADPDIVRLLKESHLPLLRWPGGNFVSTYHWEDGIGPVEKRVTGPNLAWGRVEPNTFGTDEFISFCRAVGCEPMICVNAGSGTPAEAARWIEYCNGPASSPMGRLRAANGHPGRTRSSAGKSATSFGDIGKWTGPQPAGMSTGLSSSRHRCWLPIRVSLSTPAGLPLCGARNGTTR